MVLRNGVRPARLLTVLAGAIVLALGLGIPAAFAAEIDPPQGDATFEQLFMQLQDTPVYKDACTKTCHGNIAKTDNYASSIIFKHGYHQLVACSACHPRFPHRSDANIERPTMKGCFDCHGLRHGPMGEIASGECEDCHVTAKERLRPAFHTFGWEGKPHVEPSNKEFNTKCAMCHEPASCTDCHARLGIRWTPERWEFDAGDGCLSCHGNEALTKQSSAGLKSFAISGLVDSAHRDLSCQQCHPDYRYDDKPSASPLWHVNAGEACANCHRTAEEGKWAESVEAYERSTHAKAIKSGNFDSATCASCHGGHYIFRLDTVASQQRMHLSAYRTCARCKQHGDEYDTYDDYYHGKAYKAGNLTAPSCWDCHGAHDIQPSSDPVSMVSSKNIGETCGQEGCHKGSSEQFGEAAAALIHEKVKQQEDNPLLRLIARITGR
jgi:hypothetical protein